MAEAVEVCIGVMHEIGVGLIGAKGVMWLSVGLEVGLRQIRGCNIEREPYRSSRWTFVESFS